MNTHEFISSGIIEAYVTGCASAAERAQVDDMAIRYPEVKAELESVQKTMNAYTYLYSVSPPSYLKDKIIAAATSGDITSLDNKKDFKINEPKERNNKNYGYVVFSIAAAIALLVTLPMAGYLYIQLKSNKSTLAVLKQKQQTMSAQMQDSALAYQSMRNEIEVFTDPMYKMIQLKGMKAAPDAKAMVCWCPDSKELYFKPETLPLPPKGMQYQLWAIVNGKPVDAGMINIDAGMQEMKLTADASAFCVSLEKQGGSTEPHGNIYVMGSI